jgi:uncharacterized caspase-like protein
MFLRCLFCVFCALLTFATAGDMASAEPRTALVLGNSAYGFAPLVNPANDATDVAAALRESGFDVTLKLDADRDGMADAIHAFGETLKKNSGMGLFFFAGHGVQINGENYLVPVGDSFGSEADLTSRAVKTTTVVDAMAAAKNSLNIVILDACRDNALGKSNTRGLTRIDTNARLFISYSTSPGSVAQDGRGRNSPYTKYLTEAISTPDLTLEQAFKTTLKGVYKETRGQQTPWISSSFFGDFSFRSAPSLASHESNTAAVGASAAPTLSGVYRVEGLNPGGRRYKGMVVVNQVGDKFAFKWWVGTQTFDGSGELAGKMLVVNWGDKTPVVYTFGALDSLDGEWADGSATERLTLYARASGNAAKLNGGTYDVRGYDANGRRYQGTVGITPHGGRYEFEWKIVTCPLARYQHLS